MDPKDLLTSVQAAEYLGVTRQAVNLMTRQGYGRRLGRDWFFTRAELDRWKATPRHPGGRPKNRRLVIRRTRPAAAA